MNQFRNIIFSNPLEFQITRPSPCSYLLRGVSNNGWLLISHAMPNIMTIWPRLVSGVSKTVYKPICSNCNACLPIRIPAGKISGGRLELSRNQRRVINRNADLQRNVLPNFSRQDHYDLFRHYLEKRHSDGQMAEMDEEKYAAMISSSPIETVLIEYRLEDCRLPW